MFVKIYHKKTGKALERDTVDAKEIVEAEGSEYTYDPPKGTDAEPPHVEPDKPTLDAESDPVDSKAAKVKAEQEAVDAKEKEAQAKAEAKAEAKANK